MIKSQIIQLLVVIGFVVIISVCLLGIIALAAAIYKKYFERCDLWLFTKDVVRGRPSPDYYDE